MEGSHESYKLLRGEDMSRNVGMGSLKVNGQVITEKEKIRDAKSQFWCTWCKRSVT